MSKSLLKHSMFKTELSIFPSKAALHHTQDSRVFLIQVTVTSILPVAQVNYLGVIWTPFSPIPLQSINKGSLLYLKSISRI